MSLLLAAESSLSQSILECALLLLISLVAAIALYAWQRKRSLFIETPPLRPIRGRELLLVIALYLIIMPLVIENYVPAKPEGPPPADPVAKVAEADLPSADQIAVMLQANLVGSLLVMAASLAALWRTERRTLTELGLSLRYWRRDVVTGALMAVSLLGPVMLVQELLVHWVPYQHELIDVVVKKHRTELLGLVSLNALFAAPLVEEFFCRQLIQGWFIGLGERLRQRGLVIPSLEPGWGAIIGASFIFAAAHSGQGAAPIPLFLLSLGLGYLYHRTRRLYPSFIAHAVFNSFTVVQLWFA